MLEKGGVEHERILRRVSGPLARYAAAGYVDPSTISEDQWSTAGEMKTEQYVQIKLSTAKRIRMAWWPARNDDEADMDALQELDAAVKIFETEPIDTNRQEDEA